MQLLSWKMRNWIRICPCVYNGNIEGLYNLWLLRLVLTVYLTESRITWKMGLWVCLWEAILCKFKWEDSSTEGGSVPWVGCWTYKTEKVKHACIHFSLLDPRYDVTSHFKLLSHRLSHHDGLYFWKSILSPLSDFRHNIFSQQQVKTLRQ